MPVLVFFGAILPLISRPQGAELHLFDRLLAAVRLLHSGMELFKQYSDNVRFNRWLADTVFAVTYGQP